MRNQLKVVWVAAMVLAFLPGPVFADGGGDVGCDDQGCGGVVVIPGTPGSPPGNTTPVDPPGDENPPATGPQPTCPLYKALSPQPAADSELWEGHGPKDGVVQVLNFLVCTVGVDGALYRFVANGEPAAPVETPQGVAGRLAARAEGEIRFPVVEPEFGPSPDKLAVNFPVWVYLDRDEVQVPSRTISEGAVSITMRAELTSLTFSPGEWRDKNQWRGGGTVDAVDCTQLFTPPPANWSVGDRPACGYTYRYRSDPDRTGGSGRWTATVSAHWRVTWTSVGAGGVGGVIDPPAAMRTVPMVIGEWRTSGGYVSGGGG